MSALLPSADNDLIRLKLDALGATVKVQWDWATKAPVESQTSTSSSW